MLVCAWNDWLQTATTTKGSAGGADPVLIGVTLGPLPTQSTHPWAVAKIKLLEDPQVLP